MSEAFLKVVNMSISAGWLVLAVLALRLILKKAPKWVNVLLWGIVAIRLICPFSIESALSLIPSTETISPEIMMDWTPEISTGIEPLDKVVNPVISTSFAPEPSASANPLQILIPVAANLWLLGVLIMLAYTAISYLSLRRKLRTAVILRGNIFRCETVSSPFVLGILKPRIYLPYTMDGKNLDHVVAHEQAHICRKDHWWKPLGFLLLTVYWFNPLMWVAYIMLCRDIELACDEKVIAQLGNEQRADYTHALVACAVNRRMIAACPLAFGEVGVKDRVKSIMNYKKPAFWVIILAIITCIVVAICFLTNPAKNDSWIKATYGATSVELECNFAAPIHSYAIYEDIYENGELTSSKAIVFDYFQEEGGATPRRTTLSLNAQPVNDEKGGFTGELSLNFGGAGTAHMTRKLPQNHYTDAVHIAAEIGDGIFSKQKVATEDNVTLLTILLSTDLDGIDTKKVVIRAQNNTLVQSNDTVVIYRLVTSEDGDIFNRINKPAQLGSGQSLSLNDVIMLSQKGHDLSWADFEQYKYIETGSGLYIRVYKINDLFELWIGGAGPNSEPMYIYLSLADDLDTKIDIRDGGVTDFISDHNDITNEFTGVLHLGLNAEIVEIDSGNQILYVKDIDEGAAIFGDRCAIDCSYAISRYNLLYVNYGDPNDVRTIDFVDFKVGDSVIIGMYDSEMDKAFNGSAVAEQIQLGTQRFSTETAFELNFAGNTSLQHKIVLAEERPYWCIFVENQGSEKIVTEIGGDVCQIEPGTFDTIYSNEKSEPGTYSVSFGSTGASGMTGSAVCYTYKYRLEITGRLNNAVKDTTYILLSNIEGITFEQAWKASGLSSNLDDYFDPADAVFIGVQ